MVSLGYNELTISFQGYFTVTGDVKWLQCITDSEPTLKNMGEWYESTTLVYYIIVNVIHVIQVLLFKHV